MAEKTRGLSYYRKKNSNKRQATEELEKLLRDNHEKRSRVDVNVPTCSAGQVTCVLLISTLYFG